MPAHAARFAASLPTFGTGALDDAGALAARITHTTITTRTTRTVRSVVFA